MPSHYSIIRFVPDSVTDERVNIGVVAVGDGGPQVRFLRHWRRVREFADVDPKALRDFVKALLDESANEWTRDNLERFARTWTNSIQFSEPSASLESTVEAVEWLAAALPAGRGRSRARLSQSKRSRTTGSQVGQVCPPGALWQTLDADGPVARPLDRQSVLTPLRPRDRQRNTCVCWAGVVPTGARPARR